MPAGLQEERGSEGAPMGPTLHAPARVPEASTPWLWGAPCESPCPGPAGRSRGPRSWHTVTLPPGSGPPGLAPQPGSKRPRAPEV